MKQENAQKIAVELREIYEVAQKEGIGDPWECVAQKSPYVLAKHGLGHIESTVNQAIDQNCDSKLLGSCLKWLLGGISAGIIALYGISSTSCTKIDVTQDRATIEGGMGKVEINHNYLTWRQVPQQTIQNVELRK